MKIRASQLSHSLSQANPAAPPRPHARRQPPRPPTTRCPACRPRRRCPSSPTLRARRPTRRPSPWTATQAAARWAAAWPSSSSSRRGRSRSASAKRFQCPCLQKLYKCFTQNDQYTMDKHTEEIFKEEKFNVVLLYMFLFK